MAYRLLLIESRSFISLDFLMFLSIAQGFQGQGAEGVGAGLEKLVAPCGENVRALQDHGATREPAPCSIARLQSAGWWIARYCCNG